MRSLRRVSLWGALLVCAAGCGGKGVGAGTGGGPNSSGGRGGGGSGGITHTGGAGDATGGAGAGGGTGGAGTGGGTGGAALGTGGGGQSGGGGRGTGGRAATGGAGGSSSGGAGGQVGTGGVGGALAGTGGQGGGCVTSVSGTVFDPAGKVPLYNAMVYAPTTAVAPIADVLGCVTCSSTPSGNPIAITRTDAGGRFRLNGVPAGTAVPLVIQVGKWRREIAVPNVARCADTAITDPNLTRLPRNSSEGHIPRIALSTGGADALECLLRKVGIDDSEFTPETGTGRVNFFAGSDPVSTTYVATSAYSAALNAGAAFTTSQSWWDGGLESLRKYDLILLSCQGAENPTNISMAARQAMFEYANAGGRVFMSHWHNYWIERGVPDWQSVASWRHQADPASPAIGTVDTSFPQGAALADWLVNVAASVTRGEVSIRGAKRTATSVREPARAWINGTAPTPTSTSVQYFSFPTPVAGPTCGEVIFSDLHVSAGTGDQDKPGRPFPEGCETTDLSPQEKVLEFMLFDLLGCL